MRSIMVLVAAALLISTASPARADVITVVSRSDTIFGTDGIDSYSETGNGPLSDSVSYFFFYGGSGANSVTGDFSVGAGAYSVDTPSNELAFASTGYVLTPLTSDIAFEVKGGTGNAALLPALSASYAFYDITLGQALMHGGVAGIYQQEDQTFQFVLDPTHQYGLLLSASVGGRVGEVGADAGISVTFSQGTGIPTFPPPEPVPLPAPAWMAFFLASCIGGWAALRRSNTLIG